MSLAQQKEVTKTEQEVQIERLLNLMATPWWTTKAREAMRRFDDSLPFYGPFLSLRSQMQGKDPGVWADAESNATGRLTDISLIVNPTGKDEDLQFLRVKFDSLRKVRMEVCLMQPSTGSVKLQKCAGVVSDKGAVLKTWDGVSFAACSAIQPGNPKSLIDTQWNKKAWFNRATDFRDSVMVAPGLYFNLYHTWTVSFCVPGSPYVRFPVAPAIALELFRDRENEPGKLRRDALLHWVSAHLRRKPSSEVTTEVRRHVRGREAFFWRGFGCVIQPDLDYIENLKGTWK